MKKPSRDEILNLWLEKYHNVTVEQVIATHSKEVLESSDWFKLYPCTKEQCDEWEKETKELLKKKYKFPKWMIEKEWWNIYLECCPYENR